jgi:hypothetical protein
VRVENTREVAIVVIDATASLANVEIQTVDAQACVESTCVGDPAGHGIAVVGAGTATVSRFSVSDPFLCGVFLSNTASLDLTTGVVRRADIGACIQVPDYDTSRLTNEVVFVDNDVNLDATMLPVPGLGDVSVVEGP